jgi:hypothetical protein
MIPNLTLGGQWLELAGAFILMATIAASFVVSWGA